MKLVKDLSDSGSIVFYWTYDEAGEAISPELKTLQLADEWRKNYLFSQYEGMERRQSIIDRRKNGDKRKKMEKNYKSSRQNPQGRRESDQTVNVDIDLFQEKIKAFL